MKKILMATVVLLVVYLCVGCKRKLGEPCFVEGECQSNICSCANTCTNIKPDLSSDPNNCGACQNKCPSDRVCQQGACSCPAGKAECDGTCRDLRSDRNHCGACGQQCPADHVCINGAPVRPARLHVVHHRRAST